MGATLRIGTRGSRLAMKQADTVASALSRLAPHREIVITKIGSEGDRHPQAPLHSLGVGAFTSALEQALIEQHVDLAVHSLKDLPTTPTPGLAVVSVLERADPRDVLINRWSQTLLDLPSGARIGTSSPRREAQLRHGRPELDYRPIRGNVETRIAKAVGDDYDGVVIAAAGVVRLGMTTHISEYLSPRIVVPAPGQGALAAETRADDEETLALVQSLRHGPTAAAVEAERGVLRAAGAGCLVPIGALAEVEGNSLILFAAVTATDGSQSYRVEVTGTVEDPDITGKAAYAALLDQGAGEVMGKPDKEALS